MNAAWTLMFLVSEGLQSASVRPGKSEARRPKPERSPKPKTRNHWLPCEHKVSLPHSPMSAQPEFAKMPRLSLGDSSLRISAFGLLSDFGLRTSDLAPHFLIPRHPPPLSATSA
jgi:hypothetical protein